MLRELRLERTQGCRQRVLRLLRFPERTLAQRGRLILKEGRSSTGKELGISKCLMSFSTHVSLLPSW